ncbi:hypothetical protein [Bartonella sp. TP]|uniref:hypothetical protein n=1 Tax=Bartonella sp. TP TaxID=3057550 RepID=UPI0025B198BD|nr:hypothetical protein [Bartonella sp. TP]WJW79985.1 hypothetical protein QVL57_05660 [Bartonella sp. TP]
MSNIKNKIEIARAIELRARHLGISVDMAKDPRSISAVGRLLLKGNISPLEHSAAEYFFKLHNDYFRAKGYPSAVYHNDGIGSASEEERLDILNAISERYKQTMYALEDVSKNAPLAIKAMQIIVIDNNDSDDLIGPLRIALGHLYEHFNKGKSNA